ncbi:hypothetical protein Rhe02_64150 [Rhizocola hellebori]|uniref:Uncharacterized protein n=1 Tax=Rhizocola hellebori TaxID=1392758 RepID=A0A8J3QEV8_9ACTN|nr:hypothetical protein [Rhizocola hellebori]GIH08348.1 hypothetical protein Rhe02_64150 [Rhizocola hellebori]
MTGNQPVAVDLLIVEVTRAAMEAAAARLRTGLRQVDSQIQHGVWLGERSPSGELDAARRALREALRVHAYNSGNQIAMADHLASTIKIVLQHYRSTDELTRLDVQRMEALLEEALPQRPTAKHWVEQ